MFDTTDQKLISEQTTQGFLKWRLYFKRGFCSLLIATHVAYIAPVQTALAAENKPTVPDYLLSSLLEPHEQMLRVSPTRPTAARLKGEEFPEFFDESEQVLYEVDFAAPQKPGMSIPSGAFADFEGSPAHLAAAQELWDETSQQVFAAYRSYFPVLPAFLNFKVIQRNDRELTTAGTYTHFVITGSNAAGESVGAPVVFRFAPNLGGEASTDPSSRDFQDAQEAILRAGAFAANITGRVAADSLLPGFPIPLYVTFEYGESGQLLQIVPGPRARQALEEFNGLLSQMMASSVGGADSGADPLGLLQVFASIPAAGEGPDGMVCAAIAAGWGLLWAVGGRAVAWAIERVIVWIASIYYPVSTAEFVAKLAAAMEGTNYMARMSFIIKMGIRLNDIRGGGQLSRLMAVNSIREDVHNRFLRLAKNVQVQVEAETRLRRVRLHDRLMGLRWAGWIVGSMLGVVDAFGEYLTCKQRETAPIQGRELAGVVFGLGQGERMMTSITNVVAASDENSLFTRNLSRTDLEPYIFYDPFTGSPSISMYAKLSLDMGDYPDLWVNTVDSPRELVARGGPADVSYCGPDSYGLWREGLTYCLNMPIISYRSGSDLDSDSLRQQWWVWPAIDHRNPAMFQSCDVTRVPERQHFTCEIDIVTMRDWSTSPANPGPYTTVRISGPTVEPRL